MNGMTKKYEKIQPAAKSPTAGTVIERLMLISLSFNAGLINPDNSLTITGIPKTIPASAAM